MKMTDEAIKKCFKGVKSFRYRGTKYIVNEIDLDIEGFIGIYKKL